MPVQYRAPAMSGAIGGAPPAAHATHPMPAGVIQPPQSAPEGWDPPPGLPPAPLPRPGAGMLVGWGAALPCPSAPRLTVPLSGIAGWGGLFFFYNSHMKSWCRGCCAGVTNSRLAGRWGQEAWAMAWKLGVSGLWPCRDSGRTRAFSMSSPRRGSVQDAGPGRAARSLSPRQPAGHRVSVQKGCGIAVLPKCK